MLWKSPTEKTSREVARFEKRVHKAHLKREELLASGELSVEQSLGILAIVVSDLPNYRDAATKSKQLGMLYDDYLRSQIDNFDQEAERIENERQDHYNSIRRYKANWGNFRVILQDHRVSGIVVIGHGDINAVNCNRFQDPFDWNKVSDIATHLKQGIFEQRTCGGFSRDKGRNVPLGTFAVSKFSNLLAAPGLYISDTDPGDGCFKPVYNDEIPVIDQIHSLNITHELNRAEETTVDRGNMGTLISPSV